MAKRSPVTVDPLAQMFTASAIADLAGPCSYARGIWYHRDGRAESPTSLGSGLQATVRGTVPYTVKLWVDGDRPGWSCSCPAAGDGSFCKYELIFGSSTYSDAISAVMGEYPDILFIFAGSGNDPLGGQRRPHERTDGADHVPHAARWR